MAKARMIPTECKCGAAGEWDGDGFSPIVSKIVTAKCPACCRPFKAETQTVAITTYREDGRLFKRETAPMFKPGTPNVPPRRVSQQ